MLLLASLLFAACGGTTPTPSPGNMDDVIANLVLQGVTVHRLTSGDAGCPDTAGGSVHDNAVYLEVAIGNQSALHRIHLLRWRRPADFEAGKAAFDACIEEYKALNPGVDVSTLEVGPVACLRPGLVRHDDHDPERRVARHRRWLTPRSAEPAGHVGIYHHWDRFDR